MIVGGKPYQSIWPDPSNDKVIKIINQNLLPFEFRVEEIITSKQAKEAIQTMKVRGAPLIGICGAYGIYLSCMEARQRKDGEDYILKCAEALRSARPTAVNLAWAVDRIMQKISPLDDPDEKIRVSKMEANAMMEEEKESCYRIGQHGLEIIREISRTKNGSTVNILTHCNAGWLACVDYGTATSPIYQAFDQGIPVHVWVDETRPRNQGARLTAWELEQHGVPHTIIVDNAGGHLMQKGEVDMVIVGSDRTTRTGDVANKTGTYLKALAASDNDIPFYVALPSSSIDFSIRVGLKEISVEERDPDEIRKIEGIYEGEIHSVIIMPGSSPVSNYGFDITPARLVTGIITERGICGANEKEITQLFPEH
ncbi:S-methyl-5-thioribose-1-phosphate isomerase [Bacteroidota bacterium]